MGAGLLLFLFLYLRRNTGNAFRDDLWAEKKKRAFEAQVDKKIQLEFRPDPKDAEEKPKATPSKAPEFFAPNFYGKPHEVLGLRKDPSKEQVLKAYKHWIKRYHPDRVAHLGEKFVTQAKVRAEQLNTARDELLKHAK